MKNLSTTIETTKRKTINHEELRKSVNEERDLKNKMDEFTMFTKKKRNDGDDNVNIDVVQGRSELESEEKNHMNIQMNISKKYALASDRTKNIIELGHSEENKTDELEREKKLSNKSQKEINPDDIVDTDTGTDMSETINRDHSEECEGEKKLVTQKF